jgi:hypothetical protein
MEHDVKISIELTHGEDEVLLKFLERILADDVSSTRDNFRADVSLFNMPSARPSVALETELAKTEIEKGTDGEAGQDLAGFDEAGPVPGGRR